MGNGSPRLRKRFAICALPLFVAAGSIGAPAAFADAIAPVDGLTQTVSAVADSLPAEATSVAPAEAATGVPDAATSVVAAAPAEALRAVAAKTPHPIARAARKVSSLRALAERTVAPVLAATSRLAQMQTAVETPVVPSRSVTPTTRARAAVAPMHHTKPRPLARLLQTVRGAARQNTKISRSSVVHVPLSGEGSAVRAGASSPPPDRVTDLTMGGAASGEALSAGVLLLIAVAAAFWRPLRTHGRRVAAVVGALRPTPLLLQLERPD
jgi:hypothetical protein